MTEGGDKRISQNEAITGQLERIHAEMKLARDAIYAEIVAVVGGSLVNGEGEAVELLVYDYPTYTQIMSMPVVTRNDPRAAPVNLFLSTDWLHDYVRTLGGTSAFLVREKQARSGEFIGLVGFCPLSVEERMRHYMESIARNADHALFGADYIPFRGYHAG